MGHIYKWLGTDEQARALWQNREALDKYLVRLKELMEMDESVKMEANPSKQFHSDLKKDGNGKR